MAKVKIKAAGIKTSSPIPIKDLKRQVPALGKMIIFKNHYDYAGEASDKQKEKDSKWRKAVIVSKDRYHFTLRLQEENIPEQRGEYCTSLHYIDVASGSIIVKEAQYD